jgi:BlaI family transcriptional regulator, penicillinase repressor
MTAPATPRPTESELAILNVLWSLGEATVRDVYEALYRADGGYTTALKMLQVMHGKGLVERDERQRAHVYRARITKDSTQRRMLADLARRLFGGRPAELALSALGSEEPPSTEELAQIRTLLERLEAGRDGKR